MDADKKLVPSGLFAYFSCSDSSLFLNVDTLDLDQDGMFGIQCKGGSWDLDSLPAEVNDTCITTTKCKPRSQPPCSSVKIVSNSFQRLHG